MSSHRFWRLLGLSAQGTTSSLTLTEIQLLVNSVSVTSGIIPTSTYSPMVGTLASLVDGVLTSNVSFNCGILPQLIITWDFSGSPQNVTDVRFGSAQTQLEFVLSGILQHSDNNNDWQTFFQFGAPVWPGSNSLTTSDYVRSYWNAPTPNSNPPASADRTSVSPASIAAIRGLLPRQDGICQFEVKFLGNPTPSSDSIIYLGVGVTSNQPTTNNIVNDPTSYVVLTNQAPVFAGVSNNSYPITFTSGDVVGVVTNFNTGSLEFFVNGVSKGIATADGLLGKSMVPVVFDTSGYTTRHITCTLKINSFDFPIAGAEAWAVTPLISIDPTIFRTYNGSDSYSIFFPNAAAADGNFNLKSLISFSQGNYLDPGNGTVSGYVTVPDPLAAVENLALSNLLFGSHFNGINGSNIFTDEKGHTITTFGGCKIETGGISAINPARNSVMYSPGDSGNGIRVPISSLADALNLSNGDFTIRTWFWLKEDAIAGRYGIFSWGGGYNYSYANIRLDMRTNTSVAISLRTTAAGDGPNDIASYQEIPNSFPGKNQWVHIAITRKGPLIRLWIGGNKKYEVSTPYPIHNSFNLTGIDIGSVGYDVRIAPAPSDGANGYFDDFQIFNTCLYDSDFTPDVTKEFSTVPVNLPVSRKIDLFRESDGMLIRQLWSDPITGIYKFDGLSTNYTYSVVGYDYTNAYKSTIINGRIAVPKL